jgi:hypothetical protein
MKWECKNALRRQINVTIPLGAILITGTGILVVVMLVGIFTMMYVKSQKRPPTFGFESIPF